MKTNIKDTMVTIKEAASELGLHPNTIRNYIKEGRINSTRLGPRLIRIDRSELYKVAGGLPAWRQR
jgi:excisionase family DNA binding protein